MANALTYDALGITPEAIGEPYGIAPSDRRELTERLQRGLDRIEEAHESGELGFASLPDRDPTDIVEWGRRMRRSRWTHALVLGIGGSSLGTRAILSAAAERPEEGLEVEVLENVDPETVRATLERLPLESTLVVVVTKSGTTVETMGKFAAVYDRLIDRFGRSAAADRVVAVTDPEEGALRELARRENFETFPIPPEVGGRFSVLSPVGLVPLVLAGYPVEPLLDGAARTRHAGFDRDLSSNPVARAAADLFILQRRGVDSVVMMSYCDRLATLVDWFRQLWAESLGKAENRTGELVHEGTTPIKAIGTVDQHSQIQLYREGPADKVVVFLTVDDFESQVEVPDGPGLPEPLDHLGGTDLGEIMRAQAEGTRSALADAGRPTVEWRFSRVGPPTVGGFVMAWELITALVAELLDVDAYDQPGVERGKAIAHELLANGRRRPPEDDTHQTPVLSSDATSTTKPE